MTPPVPLRVFAQNKPFKRTSVHLTPPKHLETTITSPNTASHPANRGRNKSQGIPRLHSVHEHLRKTECRKIFAAKRSQRIETPRFLLPCITLRNEKKKKKTKKRKKAKMAGASFLRSAQKSLHGTYLNDIPPLQTMQPRRKARVNEHYNYLP